MRLTDRIKTRGNHNYTASKFSPTKNIIKRKCNQRKTMVDRHVTIPIRCTDHEFLNQHFDLFTLRVLKKCTSFLGFQISATVLARIRLDEITTMIFRDKTGLDEIGLRPNVQEEFGVHHNALSSERPFIKIK